MDAQKLGQFIAERRKELGMTQKQLSEKLHVTDKAVSRWERGQGLPDVNSFAPLAEALELSISEIMSAEKSNGEDHDFSNKAISGVLEIVEQKRLERRKVYITIIIAAVIAMSIFLIDEMGLMLFIGIALPCIGLAGGFALLTVYIIRKRRKLPAKFTLIFAIILLALSLLPIPARDGRVYELRKTEMGEFIALKNNIVDFSEVRAGFSPALPRVPKELMGRIISFFRSLMRGGKEYEALAYLYWDRENEEFVAFVPKQQAGKAYVHTTLTGNCLPEERYLHYADIHSHNSMPARFSPVDNHDERATRLYIVLGNLERFYPSITVRASCGGEYVELDPNLVLEGIGEEFPTEWLDQVELGKYDCDERTIDKFLYGGFPEKQVEE